MAISPISANFAGSISALSAIQPLDVKDNALLDLLIRDRFVGSDLANVRPGAFAVPKAPAAPAAPGAATTGTTATAAAINLAHVAPGDLITSAYVNTLVDALLALDKRLAGVEARPSGTPPPPPPPVTETPVPPAAVNPNFTFTLANDLAHVELDAHEFERVNEIRIGDIVIPKNEVAIDNGIARFTAPSTLFLAGVDKTPDLTLTDTAGAARVLTGMTRVIR